MDFIDWFDIGNLDHLRAYKHLTDTGCWPKGFISDDIEMSDGWWVRIAAKMANAYIKDCINNSKM